MLYRRSKCSKHISNRNTTILKRLTKRKLLVFENKVLVSPNDTNLFG
jgi:hypothetical protein